MRPKDSHKGASAGAEEINVDEDEALSLNQLVATRAKKLNMTQGVFTNRIVIKTW